MRSCDSCCSCRYSNHYHTHTYTHIYINTYIHTYIHTCTYVNSSLPILLALVEPDTVGVSRWHPCGGCRAPISVWAGCPPWINTPPHLWPHVRRGYHMTSHDQGMGTPVLSCANMQSQPSVASNFAGHVLGGTPPGMSLWGGN